ncbi:MAG: TRAP transporter substrate-binding protein DctP [Deltaproteobacteria bacterium]|nr:TRAP transporter substrate-binding protein DctP [Deltaproteobacteria bacterium]
MAKAPWFLRLASALVASFCLTAASAEVVTVKLGTLAPDGSAWHLLLKEMAEKWAEASGGKVKLKIYPGGVAGDEGDMVRKMRVGQLSAAAVSVIGLHDIEPSPQAIATPGLIGNQAEWDHVFEKMTPVWEKQFRDKGFVTLIWGDTGWVYMFFKKEVRTPAQAKGMRVFAWAGDPASADGWKLAGFQPVVISSTDMLPSLNTGMIEGFATTPIMAFTARWYEQAKHMPDASWGHLPGATIVSKEVWDKIPPDTRDKLRAIAREYGVKVAKEVSKMQADAIAQMKKNGLKVLALDEAEKKAWVEASEKTWPLVRGRICPAEAFDEVKRVRDEYRAAKGKK